MKLDITIPDKWNDYELIDTGNFKKLERFGNYILSRPEPKAIWEPTLSDSEWDDMSDAVFRKTRDFNPSDKEEQGEWFLKKRMPEQWIVEYNYKKMSLKMRLGLTPFKHVGLFPEQSANWNYIYDKSSTIKNPKVINLFAYTGAASLAAKSAGADVVNVEALKQLIGWSKTNMENSSLSDVRWVVEDALKFIKREVKRGNKYNGIIMDPPAYGRGPNGEKWILEEGILELLHETSKIFADECFMVLNLYAKGISPLITSNLAKTIFGNSQYQISELSLQDKYDKMLPLGSLLRIEQGIN